MKTDMRKLFCINECGSWISASGIHEAAERIESVSVEVDCPQCNEITTYEENITTTVTFKCTGCDTEKEAEITPTVGQAKTDHHCGVCERKTSWKQLGWETIEVT